MVAPSTVAAAAAQVSRAGASQPSIDAAIEQGPPTIYRARKDWRRVVLGVACVLAVGALIALGAYLLAGEVLASSPAASSSAAVAVFNAGGTPGAAHRVADTLRSGHVDVQHLGNLTAQLGAGTHVLYPPGGRAQAERVARLLRSTYVPVHVQPMQPQIEAALAGHNELAVIID